MHDPVLTMLAEVAALNNSAVDRHTAADELERQADEIEKRIWETPATTLAGVLGQLGLLRPYLAQLRRFDPPFRDFCRASD